MSRTSRCTSLVLAALAAALFSGTCFGRTWTDRKGRQVEAELIAVQDGQVRIKRTRDGRLFVVPLASLSEKDQAFVASWQDKSRTQSERASDGLAVSGAWVVDWKSMMASYKEQGLGGFDAAVKVVPYSGVIVTFSANRAVTVRGGIRDYDCTATYSIVPLASEDALLNTLASYFKSDKNSFKETLLPRVRSGEIQVTVLEFISVTDGKILKGGQKCIIYSPGPKKTDGGDVAMTFKEFGADITPLSLVKADTPKGKEIIRQAKEANED